MVCCEGNLTCFDMFSVTKESNGACLHKILYFSVIGIHCFSLFIRGRVLQCMQGIVNRQHMSSHYAAIAHLHADAHTRHKDGLQVNSGPDVQKRQGGKDKQATKHELRQQARAKRKAEWESFLSTKPDNNYVSPDDAQAIIDATRNMGDYKLKSEKDYVPDESKRMTPKRKKRQVSAPICC